MGPRPRSQPPAGGAFSRRFTHFAGLFFDEFDGESAWIREAGTMRLPPLDGIVMANSLHYFKDKEKLLRHVAEYLKPGGALILVEYNVDRGNLWVPHPLSWPTFQKLAPRAGFESSRLLATHPSRFLEGFYSAIAVKPGA